MEAAVTGGGGGTQAKSNMSSGTQSLTTGGTVASNEYSSTKSKDSGVNLLVQVRNLGAEADTAMLEWYFVANPVTQGAKNYIFDKGSKEITIGAARNEKFPIESAKLQSSIVKQMSAPSRPNSAGETFSPTASMRRTGATVGGWIVRLLVDGKVAQVRASSPSLEMVAKDDAALAAYPTGR